MSAEFITDIIYKGGVPEDSWIASVPAIRYIMNKGRLPVDTGITILVGENGTGKSTLLEAVAVAAGFNPEGGTRNFSFSTNDTHSELYRALRISRKRVPQDGYFLRAETFYNSATYIDNIYEQERRMGLNTPYGSSSLHDQSHGESFMTLISKRFGGGGLYILDEPESALSPMRQMELLVIIKELEKQGAQFIIATHSPILMSCPGAKVLLLSGEGIEEIDYKNTEHFRLTKTFLQDPERMLRYLFEEEN